MAAMRERAAVRSVGDADMEVNETGSLFRGIRRGRRRYGRVGVSGGSEAFVFAGDPSGDVRFVPFGEAAFTGSAWKVGPGFVGA